MEEENVIRKATPEDSSEIANYILLAMEDILFQFIGAGSTEKAKIFLEQLAERKGNQYSYENCWVVEDKNGTIGVANIYDGAKLHELRLPVAELIITMFNRDFHPEDETQAGEMYIDCIGVHPDYQGRGIGTKLFQFLKEEYVHKQNKILGLLVDADNPHARRLYLKLGFEIQGEKTLVGKKMEHLQLMSD